MLEEIRKAIFKKYSIDEIRGLFLSGYDENSSLIFSNGVIDTDKSLGDLIDYLYYLNVEKQLNSIDNLVIDVVLHSHEISSTHDILALSTKQYGIYLQGISGTTGGVMLPNTRDVSDIKHSLQLIKQKNQITENVKLFAFKTDRLVI